MNIIIDSVDTEKYIIATYNVSSTKSLQDAAVNIAVGQSIGNPSVRSEWETHKLIEDHCCKIINTDNLSDKEGTIKVAFPLHNLNWYEDGVSQLLCFLMGGQLDINSITKCQLVKLDFPKDLIWYKPKHGIQGIRKYTKVYDKPILGGIIKPKTGISKHTLLDIVKEMCNNGINFIKEDEILANPSFCPLMERAELISDYLHQFHPQVIYAYCINGDYPYCIDRVEDLKAEFDINAIHINFWSGLGVYKTIRELDTDIFIHFQKSGDKIFTTGHFSIRWDVVCQLAGMMGIDFIHAGMWGGYSNDENLEESLKVLRAYEVMPALSCGMHPGLVDKTTELFGVDYMANVGGAIHGHPKGTGAGVRAMRQAIDKNYQSEYYEAINLWGLKS